MQGLEGYFMGITDIYTEITYIKYGYPLEEAEHRPGPVAPGQM